MIETAIIISKDDYMVENYDYICIDDYESSPGSCSS